jgi:hypothetical protein
MTAIFQDIESKKRLLFHVLRGAWEKAGKDKKSDLRVFLLSLREEGSLTFDLSVLELLTEQVYLTLNKFYTQGEVDFDNFLVEAE